jgi:hypothetical protein
MIQSMATSKNTKMCFLIKNSFNDQRSLLQRNLKIICKAWKIESSSLSDVCKNKKSYRVFSDTSQKDRPVIQAIKDFKGFMDGEVVIDNFVVLNIFIICQFVT